MARDATATSTYTKEWDGRARPWGREGRQWLLVETDCQGTRGTLKGTENVLYFDRCSSYAVCTLVTLKLYA